MPATETTTDDGHDDNKQVDTRKPAAVVAGTLSPDDVINLCQDDDDDDDNVPRRRRKRQRRVLGPSSAAASAAAAAAAVMGSAEAIDIDQIVEGNIQQQASDPALRYLQVLGPLRMDFVEAFTTTKHTFWDDATKSTSTKKSAQSSTQSAPKIKTNDLYKELLEYKLNLPMALSSSIFVRVMESRLDLVRCLITGR
jgi:hypothetical protein